MFCRNDKDPYCISGKITNISASELQFCLAQYIIPVVTLDLGFLFSETPSETKNALVDCTFDVCLNINNFETLISKKLLGSSIQIIKGSIQDVL